MTRCRSCGSERLDMVLSLGQTPLANALLNDTQVSAETFGAHTFSETGEDADLFFDLLLSHKCPTSRDAVEISLTRDA